MKISHSKTLTIDEEKKVTQMHNQTRWSSTLLILIVSFIFHVSQPLLNESGSDMDMILNHGGVLYNPVLQTSLDISFLDVFFYLFFKDHGINVNNPNLIPQYICTLLIVLYFHRHSYVYNALP